MRWRQITNESHYLWSEKNYIIFLSGCGDFVSICIFNKSEIDWLSVGGGEFIFKRTVRELLVDIHTWSLEADIEWIQ